MVLCEILMCWTFPITRSQPRCAPAQYIILLQCSLKLQGSKFSLRETTVKLLFHRKINPSSAVQGRYNFKSIVLIQVLRQSAELTARLRPLRTCVILNFSNGFAQSSRKAAVKQHNSECFPNDQDSQITYPADVNILSINGIKEIKTWAKKVASISFAFCLQKRLDFSLNAFKSDSSKCDPRISINNFINLSA